MPDATTADWVRMVIGDAPSGFVEVRCVDQRRGKPAHGTEFVALTRSDPAVWADCVAMQFDEEPHSLPCIGMALRANGASGTARDAAWVSVLWADIDFKDTPEAEAKALINAYPRAPHCIVRSGGGFHVFWRLDRPADVQDAEGRALVRGVLRQIAHDLGADTNAADVARILRVPGTHNKKHDPPVLSRITLWKDHAPYRLEDFPGETKPERVAQSVTLSAAEYVDMRSLRLSTVMRQVIEAGAPGDESSAVQSVITALLGNGLTPGQVLAVFQQHPRGIGHALIKRGHDAERWLALSIGNAQDYLAEHADAPAESVEMQEPESFASAMTRTITFPEMLIDGLLREGDIHALVADSGTGKSWLTEYVALHLATGRPVWGRHVKRMRVLIVQEEMTEALTVERMRKIARAMGLDARSDVGTIDHLYQAGVSFDNMTPLIRYLETAKYDLVVLDSFAAIKGAGCAENSNDDVTRVLTRVKREICKPYGVQVLLVHHTAKDREGKLDPKNLPRGAGAFKDVCDNVWVMVKPTGEQWAKLHLVKCRAIEEPDKPYMVRVRNTDGGGVEVALQASASDGPRQRSPRDRMADYAAYHLREYGSGLISDVIDRASEAAGIAYEVMQAAFNELSLEERCAWIVDGAYLRPAGALRVVGEG